MEHVEKKMNVVMKKRPKSTTEEKRNEAMYKDDWKDDLWKLASLKCRYIVRIFDVSEDERNAYIGTDYYEKGDLGDLMKERKRVGRPFSEAVLLLSDILFLVFLLLSRRKYTAI
jgi:serine/threonine protein kinase